MKTINITENNTARGKLRGGVKVLTVLVLTAAMSLCFCACGGGGSDDETVEITTVEDTATEATEATETSEYEKIYDEYNEKMKAAKDTDSLDKLREEGLQKMTDAMLESTEDDEDVYKDYFNKLTKQYMEYYTDLQ